MGMFYNDYDGSTTLGSNGLLFGVGDRITVSGIKLTGLIDQSWAKVNGAYTIVKIGTLNYGSKAFLVTDGGRAPQWGVGSLNVSTSFGGARLTSSSGAIVEATDKYSIHFIRSGTFETLPPMSGLSVLTLWLNPDEGPRIILDDPVTPDNPPTTPTAPSTPAAPPPIVVKRAGTTVSVPFLSSASFKPGTSALANARGKDAFIKAVQKASKTSNLNKAQSDQLMADVIKAIKDSELTRRKLTPLKGQKK